jgi:hypothetical protein
MINLLNAIADTDSALSERASGLVGSVAAAWLQVTIACN